MLMMVHASNVALGRNGRNSIVQESSTAIPIQRDNVRSVHRVTNLRTTSA